LTPVCGVNETSFCTKTQTFLMIAKRLLKSTPPRGAMRMRDHTPEETEALKADLVRYGALRSVIKDDKGQVIDGHQLEKLCGELGVPVATTIVHGAPDDAESRRHLVYKLNQGSYRTKTASEMRDLIDTELRSAPDLSDNAIAHLFAVDHKTVGNRRDALVTGGEIPHVEKVRGLDNKRYRTRNTTVATKKEREEAQRILPTLDDVEGAVSYRAARRLASAKHYDRIREEHGDTVPSDDESIWLRHGDFEELPVGNDSLQLIVTDPPYGKKHLSLYGRFSAWAKKKLEPGRAVAVMTGTSNMDEVINELGQHLDYYWTAVVKFSGNRIQYYERRIMCNVRPVLIFTKGKFTPPRMFSDLIPTHGAEKNCHPWQQGLDYTSYLVERLSNPGDLVCDPFLGSGTTAVACRDLGRVFIGSDIDPDCIGIAHARLRGELESAQTSVKSK
jgi:hypothetical protein